MKSVHRMERIFKKLKIMKTVMIVLFTLSLHVVMADGDNELDSLLVLAGSMPEDTVRLRVLSRLAEEAPDDQWPEYNRQLKTLAGKLMRSDHPEVQRLARKYFGKAIGNEGFLKGSSGEYTQAIGLFNRSVAIFRELGDEGELASALFNLGTMYSLKGNLNAAMNVFTWSYYLRLRAGREEAAVKSLFNMATMQVKSGNIAQGLDMLFQCLRMFEQQGNLAEVARTCTNIAYCYTYEEEHEKAMQFRERALQLNLQLKDDAGIAQGYFNYGVHFIRTREYEKALDMFRKSLSIREKAGNRVTMSECYSRIGLIYNWVEAFDSSVYYCRKALSIQEAAGHADGMVNSYITLGSAYNRMGQYGPADEMIHKALEVARKMGSPEYISKSELQLSEILFNRGEYKEAMVHHREYVVYKDTASNQQVRKLALSKQFQYEFDRKATVMKAEHEKKQALAAAEVRKQRVLSNSVLLGSLMTGLFSFIQIRSYNRRKKISFERQVSEVEMKALRSQMNPHFIFNALQSVNDFILKKDMANASKFLIKFSKLMRSVLENSMHREVSLEKDLASLELYMQLESTRLDKPFSYEIVVDENLDRDSILVPPLILQPFVENSIWHGLKNKMDPGKIRIEIREKNDAISCIIEDNGVGRELATRMKQPSPEKRESLGMKLTRERLKILEKFNNFRSKLEITDLKDALNNPMGLRVELSLPLSTY